MALTPEEWHARFLQQARWTHDLRNYLFERAGIESARRVLDVGSGTGVLLLELQNRTRAEVYGIDLLSDYARVASRNARTARITQADGNTLPFSSQVFDLTFCHFLLLWVSNPERVVSEMARVTRPGGSVLALAEPDYGGRIDYPEELAVLGRLQEESLKNQGADPRMGRRLAQVFQRSGLKAIEVGVLGGQWAGKPSLQELEQEWKLLQSDLGERRDLADLRALDWAARERSERVLFVPTFYAWGKVETGTG